MRKIKISTKTAEEVLIVKPNSLNVPGYKYAKKEETELIILLKSYLAQSQMNKPEFVWV